MSILIMKDQQGPAIEPTLEALIETALRAATAARARADADLEAARTETRQEVTSRVFDIRAHIRDACDDLRNAQMIITHDLDGNLIADSPCCPRNA